MENNETRYWRLGRAMIKYRNIHRLRNGNKKGLVCREPDQDISTIRDVLPAGGVWCLTKYFNQCYHELILQRKGFIEYLRETYFLSLC